MLSTLAAAVTAALALAAPAGAVPPLPPSPAITPGAGIAIHNADYTAGNSCTAGFLAHDKEGRPVMLSAGHCNIGGNVAMKWDRTGQYEPIGEFTETINEGNVNEESDIGLITLNANMPLDARILDRRPVAGSTGTVKVGDTLCKYGVPTGRLCGTVTEPPSATKVHFNAPTEVGDSGGPVYLIESNGNAVAVGVTIRHADAGGTVAELVQPWLDKWGLTLDTSVPGRGAQPVGYGR